jgi:uncharacterized membrane protein HdeD (DUF308 family)
MSDLSRKQSWWKQILLGVLAIAFGICAVALPGGIIMGRVLDSIFRVAKPFSASMTAVAAMLALVALVAADALLNLLGTGVMGKQGTRLRGAIGAATVVAAIFWPGRTAYIAVELLGVWAIAVGILELLFARYWAHDFKSRALLIVAAIASIVMGVGVMRWALVGAVVVGAVVGLAAMTRGISLMMSGILDRFHQDDRKLAYAQSVASKDDLIEKA